MDSTFMTILILGFALILLSIWVFILERRIAKLLSGKNGSSLEDVIANNQKSIESLFAFKSDAQNEFAKMNVRMKQKINGAKTIRFNPFQGTGSGGNQSFATALIDENGNGVVISSLYSREKVSIFAKPVKERASEFELTNEEREVLK